MKLRHVLTGFGETLAVVLLTVAFGLCFGYIGSCAARADTAPRFEKQSEGLRMERSDHEPWSPCPINEEVQP